MNIQVWLFIFVLCLFIIIQLAYRAARTEIKHRFLGRPILLFDQWREKFYGMDDRFPKVMLEEILSALAKEIGVDATQIRPSDRFAVEFAAKGKYRHFLVDDDISDTIEKLVKKYYGTNKVPRPETVDDLIKCIAKNYMNSC